MYLYRINLHLKTFHHENSTSLNRNGDIEI